MSKWKKVKINDIGKIVTGSTPSTKKLEYYSSKEIPFYKPGDLSDSEVRSLGLAQDYLSNCAKPIIKLLPKGSVLVTCIGIIGKVGIATDVCTCNQQINAIIPDERLINNHFLAYALINQKDHIRLIANAPVVPIINKSQFSDIEISLPPLEIQKQIAKNLDTAPELLAMRKQQLSELNNLIKSVFYDMFGDPEINEKGYEKCFLGGLCELITKGASPNWQGIDYVNDDTQTLFITSENVREGFLDIDKKKYIQDEINEIQKRSILRKGDFLIT